MDNKIIDNYIYKYKYSINSKEKYNVNYNSIKVLKLPKIINKTIFLFLIIIIYLNFFNK